MTSPSHFLSDKEVARGWFLEDPGYISPWLAISGGRGVRPVSKLR